MNGDLRTTIDFAALFEAAPNPYVLFDRDLTIVACNAAYEREVQRPRDTVIGRNLFEAFPSDPDSPGGSLLRGSLAKVLAEGRPDELALIPYDVSPTGEPPSLRYWSATHTPIFGADGRIAYVLQHTTDVTAVETLRRTARSLKDEAGILGRAAAVQAENTALAQQSEELRRLFQQTPSFMAVVSGPDHVFTLVNDAYQRLVGLDRDILGKSVAESMPEMVEQGFTRLLDQVRRTGEPFIGRGVPVMVQQPSGSAELRYLDFIYQPIRDVDGAVAGIFVQGHDITEQKLAEQELLRQREMLRIAQEAGGVGTFVWDLGTGLLTGSPTFNLLYGLPADSGPRPYTDYVDAVHPDDRERLATAAGRSLEEGLRRTEYRIVLPDGQVRWLERQGNVLRGASGAPTHVVGASFDITARQDREAQMALLTQESSHRIKNLLTMVQAIVAQTLRSADSMAMARTSVADRLTALAQAQDLLTNGLEDGAGLHDLVVSATRLHDDGQRFHVEGPNIRLGSRPALGVALMLHELGTNAAKYGALSIAEGRVDITWHTDAAGNVEWQWAERGGPEVHPPQRRGFGSSLIERGLSSLPGSSVSLTYHASGVVCRAHLAVAGRTG
ncbi:PAS domain-containing protein [Devosia albogilva]|uniref:Blue-light-activated histidine kinase n=1 Tax=Devosia albogilva TaxID=429726 RepID=A0ABW5QK72_9HYPH